MARPRISSISVDDGVCHIEFICGICKRRIAPYTVNQRCEFCEQIPDWSAITDLSGFKIKDGHIVLDDIALTEFVEAPKTEQDAFIREINERLVNT